MLQFDVNVNVQYASKYVQWNALKYAPLSHIISPNSTFLVPDAPVFRGLLFSYNALPLALADFATILKFKLHRLCDPCDHKCFGFAVSS